MKGWIIFIVLVLMAVYLFYFQPQILRTISGRVTNILGDLKTNTNVNPTSQISVPVEDELIVKCRQSYDNCKEIATQKYDVSISLIKIEKFEDKSNAEEFYNTWKGPIQIGQFGLDWDLMSSYPDNPNTTPIENYFPVVLLALKVTNPQGQLPLVVVCDNSGNLVKASKNQLQCG